MPELDHAAEVAYLLFEVPEAVRLVKITEELGEASEAYIGILGVNPRKGVTHTIDDLTSELLDIALTALVAWCGFTDRPDPLAALDDHARTRVIRHREQVN